MKNSRKALIGWLLLSAVIIAGLGFYLYSKIGHEREGIPDTKDLSPVDISPSSKELPGIAEEKTDSLQELTEKEGIQQVFSEEDYFAQIQTYMEDFVNYLDNKKYVQHLYPETSTRERFRKILGRLEAHPPIPAGEGVDPKMIIGNMYHFFRVLNRKDLRLIREIIMNEQEAMETHLNVFYRWIKPDGGFPDPEGLRPSVDVVYQYAGFFLNTTGGRAYLFRRSPGLRLLISFYSILIVNKADRTGKNNYGIDIRPFIVPLKKEISHYPDFQLQDSYIEQLNQLEEYYKEKRF